MNGAAVLWVGLAAATVIGCQAAESGAPDVFQGVIELNETVLSFEVAGRLQQLSVKEGDRVEPSALIGVLDDALVRATRAARVLEAVAARSESDLVRAGARREDVSALQARVRAAGATESSLEKQLRRQRELFERNSVPQASLDEVEGQHARARAEREALEAQLLGLVRGARPEERQGANARAEAAEAALKVEDERLERHVLKTPVGGRVLDVHVELGEVVGVGVPVATLGDTRRPHVEVFVPQGSLGGIGVGDEALIRVDSDPAEFKGRVEHLARRTEFTPRFLFSERERPNLVVRVRVRIEDPKERLHSGVPAFVTITRGPKVPSGAASGRP